MAKKQVVKITKKSGKYDNAITIKGLKAGSTKITAKCGKKKYKVKVTVKKVATPSIPTTQSTTTKGMETTTSKSAETTTSKIVAATTDKSEETTASREIEENSTSEEQTENLTTEPETTRETKLVAEVLNDGLTTDDTLQIKYYFDGPTDVVLWTTGNPEILEICEDGQWTELEHNPEWIHPIGMGGLSQEHPETLKLPLSQIYLNFKPGHYRYTRSLGTHYTYEGENPFGDSISVEFDVTYPEFYITGQVKNAQIKNTDNLEITYTVVTESEKEYSYNMQPYSLYQYRVDGDFGQIWMPKVLDAEYESQTMRGSGTIDVTVPLKEIYGDLPSGKYKYTHEIAGKTVDVEFEIVKETKLVAEVLNDGLTTDDTLQIKYYFDGPTDVVLWTNGNPHTLEIYENNQWIELEHNPEWIPPIGLAGFSQEYPEILELPLSQIYLNFKPGHYRYTRPLQTHFSYEGENPFGDSISVEFDVTYPEFYVLGQAKKKQIKNTDDLEITYTIITEDEKEYTCSIEPCHLYVWSEDIAPSLVMVPWEPVGLSKITNGDNQMMVGNNTIEITIPLQEYYDYLSPGLYKYVHKIGERDVEVIFEIVAEEEIN